jgi:hypothetical protein
MQDSDVYFMIALSFSFRRRVAGIHCNTLMRLHRLYVIVKYIFFGYFTYITIFFNDSISPIAPQGVVLDEHLTAISGTV